MLLKDREVNSHDAGSAATGSANGESRIEEEKKSDDRAFIGPRVFNEYEENKQSSVHRW